MTVAYVSQLRGTKCCLFSGDIAAGVPGRRKVPLTRPRDDLQMASDSSSAEYRAGFSECLLQVQRYLADQANGMDSEVALPQLLVDHLRRFVASAKGGDRVARSLPPPSPDTTLVAPQSVDPQPRPATSSAVAARHIVPPGHRSGHHRPLPAFLLPPSDAQIADHGRVIQTPDCELQRRLQSGVYVLPPPTVVQPSSGAPLLLLSPSTSTSASSDCTSPRGANAAATYLQPASPSNAEHDVWRPWRPETSTCSGCSDVSDSSL